MKLEEVMTAHEEKRFTDGLRHYKEFLKIAESKWRDTLSFPCFSGYFKLTEACKPLRSLLSEEDFEKYSKEEIVEHSNLAVAFIDAFLARVDKKLGDDENEDDEYRLRFVKELIEVARENENELRRLGQGRFASEDEQAEAYLKKTREFFDSYPDMINDGNRTKSILFCILHLRDNSRKREELERLIQEVEEAVDEKRLRGGKIYSDWNLDEARKELAHVYKPLCSLLSEEDFSKCSKEDIIEHSSLAIATINEILANADMKFENDGDYPYFLMGLIDASWENENELRRLGQGRFGSEDKLTKMNLEKTRKVLDRYAEWIDDPDRTESIFSYIDRFRNNSRKRKELRKLIEEVEKNYGNGEVVEAIRELAYTYKPLRSLLSKEDFLKRSKEEVIEHSSLAIAIIDELLARVNKMDEKRLHFLTELIALAWENENELRRLGRGRFASEDEQAEKYLKQTREVFDHFPHWIDSYSETEYILFYIRHLGNNSRKRKELGRLIQEVEKAIDEKRQRGEEIYANDIKVLNKARIEFARTYKPLRSLLSEEDFLKCSKEEIIEHSILAIETIDELLAKSGNTLDTRDVKDLIEIAWDNENELRGLGQGKFVSEDEQAEAYLKKAREAFDRFPRLIDDEHRTGSILFYIRHLGNNSRKREELGRLIKEVEKAMDEKRQRGEVVDGWDIGVLNNARKELAHVCKPLRSLLSEEEFHKLSDKEVIEHSSLAIATIDELIASADKIDEDLEDDKYRLYHVNKLIEVAWENENKLRRLGQGRFASEDEQAEAYLKKARQTFGRYRGKIDNEYRTKSILFYTRHLGNNSRKREELQRLIKEVEKAMDEKRQRRKEIDFFDIDKLNDARKELESLLESITHDNLYSR